ncbi:biotin transporter BioY [Ureibacillus terrenus]|uniref:Biotin transporter n=1 Tax=Ureibacillus terrenus TaxID=118246 RepID=A0A540V5Z7_9BACL|nr:biotin transporter BioY [Ureibacillus terrenus]TQE92190.1 biotin transporter BioY [Ureibacillus terrenus]
MKSAKTYGLVLTAFGAAIISVLAQITIPLPLVPITGQTLAIGLIVTILGFKYGTLSVLVYCLLGAIGLPVFTGFSGGLSTLVGPTGGYIIGFIPTALFMSWYLNKFGYTYVHGLIANVLGMMLTLAFGTIWLKFVADMSFLAAFMAGAAPFILLEAVKGCIAAWVGILVRNRLMDANVLKQVF